MDEIFPINSDPLGLSFPIKIAPSEKFKRGVGLNFREKSDFQGICRLGAEQIIGCYRHCPGDYNVYDFSIACRKCPYALNSRQCGIGVDTIFEPFFIEEKCADFIDESDAPPSFVYFISDGRYIKIGKAKDVEKRIVAIQTGNPLPLKVKYLIPCNSEESAHKIESFLHNAYAAFRMEGEWFDILGKIKEAEFSSMYGASYYIRQEDEKCLTTS